ncbi:MAG: amidohydrolase family protein [Acidobacteriaceae bacterium]
MLLDQFHPKSQLVTKTTAIEKPRFRVIDVHNHLGIEFGGGWINRPINELVDLLDLAGVKLYVDLDGGWGEEVLADHLAILRQYPERFQVFGGVTWGKWKAIGDDFPAWAAERLRIQARMGARGLKIWKNFGLTVRDQHDELVSVDDRRLHPIWKTAAELNLPVMIHVADPVAFFEPLDETNERWEELGSNPEWHFPSPRFPSFSAIIEQFSNLVRDNRETTFIGAHVGCYAENLAWVAGLIDACPNFYIDISARIGELGRQPYSSRKFILDHADRILFGSDFGPDLDAYRMAYRFLETDDEYFNYNPSEVPQQGRWYVYGIYLPDEVLKKIYSSNAEKVLHLF